MRNRRCNAFGIVLPNFSESESDIENDIPYISSNILDISNQKSDTLRLSGICNNRLP